MVTDPPSAFVVEWTRRLAANLPAPRRALDVAAGRGRHSVVLAAAGLRTFAVDMKVDALGDARSRVEADGHALLGWCADLTMSPVPHDRFELVVVTRYLQRDLFPALARALTAGGVILYETFTEKQRALGRGPTSPDHLLRSGELREAFPNFEMIFYEEVVEAEAVARLVARKVRGIRL